MSDVEQPNFFHPQAYSVRTIDPQWVSKRTEELGDEQAALNEVLEQLMVRVDQNYDESRDPLVYMPDGEGEPYILAIPICNVPVRKRPKAETPVRKHQPNPDNKRSSLRDDFEQLVFEIYPTLNKSDLAKENDIYINPLVKASWEGFKLHHSRLTEANSHTYRDNYNKTLGRYVIGKINQAGVALFNHAPYRHLTLTAATEEAKRLTAEKNEAFGIFRCLDIIGKPRNS